MLSVIMIGASVLLPYRSITTIGSYVWIAGEPGYTFLYPQIMLVFALITFLLVLVPRVPGRIPLLIAIGNIGLLIMSFFLLHRDDTNVVLFYKESWGFYLASAGVVLQTNACVFHLSWRSAKAKKKVFDDNVIDQ